MKLISPTNKTYACLGIALLATNLALNNTAQATVLYNITDLGTLGGHFSEGLGINASGLVTGISGGASDGWEGHAFVTTSTGGMLDLGALHHDPLPINDSRNDSGGALLGGKDINVSGQVTGNYMSADRYYRAFVTDSNNQMIDVGTLGGSYSFGNAINDSGQVTGSSDIVNSMGYSRERAYVTNSSGQLTDLGTLGDGYFSRGNDINASGQVTGISSVNYDGTFGSEQYHAFVTDSSGAMIDLGTLGGNNSTGNAINDAGLVTGAVETDSIYGIYHAFVTNSNGQMIDLDPLSKMYSSVGMDINNSGQIIGQYQERLVVYEYGRGGEIIGQHLEGGETRSFVTIDGAIVDLDTLLIAATGWTLHGTPGVNYATVTAINDAGQITGYGNFNSQTRAFLLTPTSVPIPSAIWLFGSGLIGFLGFKRQEISLSKTELAYGSPNAEL